MKTFRIGRKLRSALVLLGAATITFGAFNAYAQRIYVNDVDVTNAQLKDWSLTRVDKVDFDAEGNVRISAPSYSVQVVPAGSRASADSAPAQGTRATPSTTPAQRPATPAQRPANRGQSTAASAPATAESAPMTIHYQAQVSMAHRYLLTLVNPNRGSVPYDVDVLVNGKHVVTYTADRGNSAMDVSQFVQQGQNTVSFAARRQGGAATARDDAEMTVMLGVGAYDGRTASYEHILLGMTYVSGDTRSVVRNTLTFQIE